MDEKPQPHTRWVNGEEYIFLNCKRDREGNILFYRYEKISCPAQKAYFASLEKPAPEPHRGGLHNPTVQAIVSVVLFFIRR